jgi:hypothetical protein
VPEAEGAPVGDELVAAEPGFDPDDEIVEHEDALPDEEPAAPPGED